MLQLHGETLNPWQPLLTEIAAGAEFIPEMGKCNFG